MDSLPRLMPSKSLCKQCTKSRPCYISGYDIRILYPYIRIRLLDLFKRCVLQHILSAYVHGAYFTCYSVIRYKSLVCIERPQLFTSAGQTGLRCSCRGEVSYRYMVVPVTLVAWIPSNPSSQTLSFTELLDPWFSAQAKRPLDDSLLSLAHRLMQACLFGFSRRHLYKKLILAGFLSIVNLIRILTSRWM